MTLQATFLSVWPEWLVFAGFGTEVGSTGSVWIDTSRQNLAEMYIGTLEGTMRVSWGDYIIQGVKGELYACKPDIFEMTYEKVEEAP